MRSRLSRALATLISLFVLGTAVPALAAASQSGESVGIRLLDAPSNRANDPRARLYIVDHLAPGTTIERRIEVSNDTSKAQEIRLYPAAARVRNGKFEFGEGREANELTRWTTVTPATVTVPAGQDATANVKIVVPPNAVAGEKYAVVWAELRAVATETEGVGAVNRVGIRVYLSVGPGGEPPTDFEVAALRAKRDRDGLPVVEATVRNTGGRAVDLTGELELGNGPGGLSAGPFKADLGTTLAPGDEAPVRVTLDRSLPDGPWDAHLEMRSGETVKETDATITFPAPGQAAAPVEPDSGLPLAYLAGGAALFALLFALWVLFLRRRRRRDEEPVNAAPAATVVTPSAAPAAVTQPAATQPAATQPAAASAPARPPQAWYPDPERPGQLRWWDGEKWTDHRHPA